MSSPLISLMHRFEPESAHKFVIAALKFLPTLRALPASDPLLRNRVWDMDFVNPIGVAAGFDKNAEIGGKMFRFGFGFVEMGTVTPMPQLGNSKPRIFRLIPDRAVINRLGFNNCGLDRFHANLAKIRRCLPDGAIIGANIGMNKDATDKLADIRAGIISTYPTADYVTINISSPNTPGLRDWQTGDGLLQLIAAAKQTRASIDAFNRKPILFKIAPDLTYDQLEFIADTAIRQSLDGVIISNTTTARARELESPQKSESGGLSGRPLFNPSTKALRQFYRFTAGKIPIIGVGGISNGHDAYRKIKAGASLVQIYTAMVYHGLAVARTAAMELAELLRADGFSSLSDAVGVESDSKFDDNRI